MDLDKLIKETEEDIKKELLKRDEICMNISKRVLDSFIKNKVSTEDLNGTTGYGYNDIGRDKIEKIYSDVLGAEDALVRSNMISGTHALTVALFAILRPGDTMLSITGSPYDTLHEVIGIKDNPSSLKAFGINYKQIDLIDNEFDIDKIKDVLKNEKIKLIEIQRSKGYSTRKSITIEKLKKVINEIRSVDKEVIIFVDNCYCEFVEELSPLEVGADLIAGSLIKNLGGGIAPNGGYIAGKKELIELASERLAIPGEGKNVGATLDMNRKLLQGLYMAPSAVNNAVKTAIFTSKALEDLGYEVEPKYNDDRADTVQAIIFNDENKLSKYVKGIQTASAIDSNVTPIADDMPGYDDKVIMAAGTFIQGSTIEISCDGPLREPYVAYQQGSLTYEYGKLAVINAVKEIIEK